MEEQETSNWHKTALKTRKTALTAPLKNDTMELCDIPPKIMKEKSVLS